MIIIKKKHMDVHEVNSLRSYVDCTVDYEYSLYGHPFAMNVMRIIYILRVNIRLLLR